MRTFATILTLLAVWLSGCATKPSLISECRALPVGSVQKIAEDAVQYISSAFPANDTRIIFPAADDAKLAPLLNQNLRQKGFQIDECAALKRVYFHSRVRGTFHKILTAQGAFEDSDSMEEPLDDHSFRLRYAIDAEEPGFFYFSINIGRDWQFSRLYRMTEQGLIVPHSAPAIKNNSTNSDHAHL